MCVYCHCFLLLSFANNEVYFCMYFRILALTDMGLSKLVDVVSATK